MKKRLIAFVLLILLCLSLPLAVVAQSFHSGDSVVLSKSETISSDYFAAGKSVTIDGTVNGDVYTAGGTISISGTINGDVLAAGGTIDISGTINGNIRTAGGTIHISGPVARNVTVVGGNLTLAKDASISGSLVAAGGNTTVQSTIAKGVTLGAGEATINGYIKGDVQGGIGSLTIGPDATIAGNITYWSNTKAKIADNAKVSGSITQHQPPVDEKEVQKKTSEAAYSFLSFFSIISFLSALLAGSLLLKFTPVFFEKTVQAVRTQTLKSIGIGFLLLVISPFAFILLLITLIGIPFALMWLFLLIVYMWLSKLFVAYILGEAVLKYIKKDNNPYLILFIGLLLYGIINAIPVFGGIAGFIAMLTGIGALILVKKEYIASLHHKKLL